jgi:hypothetical protein
MLETKLVGVLGLSKGRYGVAFDTEDLALINTIARQAASCFLSAQAAASIVRSKELETFHLFHLRHSRPYISCHASSSPEHGKERQPRIEDAVASV